MLKELGSLGQAVRVIEEVIRERQQVPDFNMWDEVSHHSPGPDPQASFSADQRAIIGVVEATTSSSHRLTRDPH